jgi:hypothetical protein
MKGTISFILYISFFVLSTAILAQDEQEHDHDHEHHDHHHSHKNEFGGAVGMVFNLNEQEIAPGFHLHYTRMFGGKLKNFGLSPGFGFIVGDHNHYAAHLMVVFRPIHAWWIGAGPGVTYFDHHDEWAASGHFETGYEFDLGKVHLGPVVEYVFAKDDQHFMLGVHLGVPF